MWLYILQGIGYGFAAGVQPGPLQTYIISQTLTRGWRRVFPAALAPLISDGPIIAICLLVLSQIPLWLQRFLYVAGGLFVLHLAYGAYQTWKNFNPNIPSTDLGIQKSILKAVFVNNPSCYLGMRLTKVHEIQYSWGIPTTNRRNSWTPKL